MTNKHLDAARDCMGRLVLTFETASAHLGKSADWVQDQVAEIDHLLAEEEVDPQKVA